MIRGLLISWSNTKHCGVIFAEDDQRYFVHLNNFVIGGPFKPPINSEVTFEVDPTKPVLPGKYPKAKNVVILTQLQAEKGSEGSAL